MREQIRRVLYGQDELLDEILAALVAGGHVLIEGKPGLGKTHLVLALAKTFGGQFGRIQFTPDLMPTDVTGHTLFDMSSQTFRMRKGPVFTNLLLADEINRAPAKTQAALLEVMQEAQVTIDGESHELAPPFMTLATQNPIEQDGTYPLPEAQLDRFLMKVLMDYPGKTDEVAVVREAAGGVGGRGLDPRAVETVCSPEEIIKAQETCSSLECVNSVVEYAVDVVRATRDASGVSVGAGTRGAIGLVRAGKAYALLDGRGFVTPADIKRATLPVLRHRITLSAELAIAGQTPDSAIRSIIDSVEAPRQ
ncbi:MAG: MoxR family ATPase [Verrucomicrobiota bacterium]